MHDLLLQTLRQIAPLEIDEEQFFKSIFKEMHIKKGDFFLEAGEINNKLGFVIKGLVRYFVYKNEDDSTIEFTSEGEFIAEYQSFLDNSEAIQYIQAIEDTTLLVTDNDSIQQLYNKTKHGNLIGRLVIEYRYNHLMRQLLSIYMHDPEQRYRNFIKVYPNLIQRVPQYYIASYVGVKPQSLSRIRKRIANPIY